MELYLWQIFDLNLVKVYASLMGLMSIYYTAQILLQRVMCLLNERERERERERDRQTERREIRRDERGMREGQMGRGFERGDTERWGAIRVVFPSANSSPILRRQNSRGGCA
eukprot:1330006-Amorphochlora_amoeboformis.AAC.1